MEDRVVVESIPNNKGFVVREDLLPYGGGHKVRRLHRFFDSPKKRIAALSDRGSHTFWTLSKLLEDHPEIESATFFERQTKTNPYREALRKEYCMDRRIRVVQKSSLALLLSYLWTKWFRKKRVTTLGIGANIPHSRSCYHQVMAKCLEQTKGGDFPTYHIVPIASGNMADGFLSLFKDQGLKNHKVCGVLTGPLLSRVFIRCKYLFSPQIQLHKSPPLKWEEYLTLASLCDEEMGVSLDPTHSAQAYSLFKERAGEDTLFVFWATAPQKRFHYLQNHT